jgi:hypothetical protein
MSEDGPLHKRSLPYGHSTRGVKEYNLCSGETEILEIEFLRNMRDIH